MIGSKYRLGERIGAGGMAEVFRADLVGTQGFERPVAIKRVLPKWSEDAHYAEMFGHEARILAGLRHPNVVAVSDFARDEENRLFLAMELIEGVELRRLLQTGSVPVAVAIYVVSELLRGLGYMHDQVDGDGNALELVHRDLSPNNVLVSWDGAVKLSDFGLTKAYAGNLAGDSDGYGTPGYMSPEQVRGGQIDRRSDLFAVGVILYELLTGSRPFVGHTRNQLDLAVLRQRIAPPRELQQEIPADLDALTMQLLARERTQRPASAHAVLEALEGCAAASHRGRTQLSLLLRERCSVSGPKRGGDSEAPRKTERAAARSARHAAPITKARMRWGWAAGLLLVLGSVTGSVLLRHGASPARPTPTTKAAPGMDGTRTTITGLEIGAPRRTSATEQRARPKPERPETTRTVKESRPTLAGTGHVPARSPAEPGGTFPYFFATEHHR